MAGIPLSQKDLGISEWITSSFMVRLKIRMVQNAKVGPHPATNFFLKDLSISMTKNLDSLTP